MFVEAGVIGFLSFWLLNEYFYNAYFRTYLDQALGGHIAAYSSVVGVGIGLAGSAVAATLYRNLRHAKRRLETVAAPRIRGAVEKILSGLPTLDDQSPVNKLKQTSVPIAGTTSGTENLSTVKVSDQSDLKKESS